MSNAERQTRRRSSLRRLTALLLAICCGVAPAFSQSFNEYQLKAVFLFRFTQFVEWPTTQTASDSPFSICVLGNDPFEGYLEETVRDESVQNRKVTIAHYSKLEDVGRCEILFVSESERQRFKQITAQLKGRGILTVGDSGNFAQQGGMIEFTTEEKRIRLKINVDAARAAELQISSKLLRPATIVSERG
jgi:hypothetical protein